MVIHYRSDSSYFWNSQYLWVLSMWGTPTYLFFIPLVSKATGNLYWARIKETGLHKDPRNGTNEPYIIYRTDELAMSFLYGTVHIWPSGLKMVSIGCRCTRLNPTFSPWLYQNPADSEEIWWVLHCYTLPHCFPTVLKSPCHAFEILQDI